MQRGQPFVSISLSAGPLASKTTQRGKEEGTAREPMENSQPDVSGLRMRVPAIASWCLHFGGGGGCLVS